MPACKTDVKPYMMKMMTVVKISCEYLKRCLVGGNVLEEWMFFTYPYLYKDKGDIKIIKRSEHGSVVRAGDLNTEDPGSNPQLGLVTEWISPQ